MNTYNERLAMLAQDLINSFDLYLAEPEHLRTPADLRRFLKAHGMNYEEVTQADLDNVRNLRELLRSIWNSPTVDEALLELNRLLLEIPVALQLTSATPDSVHFRFNVASETALLPRLAADCAIGIAFVLQTHGLRSMRACAAEPCRDVFVDTSRNKSRRFCSDRCANRHNIAAFRERQKGSDDVE